MLSSSETFPQESTSEESSNLTKYPPGSIKQLCAIALPLMLSTLSGTLMLFIDRLVLSHYSLAAMNAAAAAGVVFAIFQFSSISIASIAEVFVGQHNGAKQFQELAKPVWQMIWFSLMTFLPFIILGLYSALWLPAEVEQEGAPFLKWLMLLGPAFPLNAALASFYIGQGRIRLVTFSIAFASLTNLLLDIILVFGTPLTPAFGTKGAAIATGGAQVLSALILFIRFIQKDYRVRFGTGHWHLNLPLLRECLRVGVPNAVGHMVAITAWVVVTSFLAKISFAHMTLFAIAQSIWILLSFIADSTQKAVSAIASNLIGANQTHIIKKVFRAGVLLQVIIALILAVPFIFFPEYLIKRFLSNETHIDAQLEFILYTSCKWVLLGFFFDGLVWVICGVLTAAKDTGYVMLVNTLNSWLFGVIPFYIAMVYYGCPPQTSCYLMCMFSFINMLCFLARFKSARWRVFFSPDIPKADDFSGRRQAPEYLIHE